MTAVDRDAVARPVVGPAAREPPARGVSCVVVTVDSEAFDRAMHDADAARGIAASPTRPTRSPLQRARALRHALAEYELPVYVVTPGRPLAEALAR